MDTFKCKFIALQPGPIKGMLLWCKYAHGLQLSAYTDMLYALKCDLIMEIEMAGFNIGTTELRSHRSSI